MGGDITVKLSPEEQILNALSRVTRRRGEGGSSWRQREFDAVKEVLDETLRLALKPLANLCDPSLDIRRDDYPLFGLNSRYILVGDVRRAVEVMALK